LGDYRQAQEIARLKVESLLDRGCKAKLTLIQNATFTLYSSSKKQNSYGINSQFGSLVKLER
jgi:hypothetical protein